jgi:hypothetical protein
MLLLGVRRIVGKKTYGGATRLQDPSNQPLSGGHEVSPGRKPRVKRRKYLSRGAATPTEKPFRRTKLGTTFLTSQSSNPCI